MLHSSVQCIVENDLNLKTFRRREVQLLSDVDKKKRLRACQQLKMPMTADWLRLGSQMRNCSWFKRQQIPRMIASTWPFPTSTMFPPEQLLEGRKHFSQSVMVSVALSKHGKTSLVFVDRGAKMNSSYYCDYELGGNGLLCDIRRLSGNHFVFQQDGEPAHRSRHTVAFLTANVPKFIEPENWPPNSPDINPVDCWIWGALQ